MTRLEKDQCSKNKMRYFSLKKKKKKEIFFSYYQEIKIKLNLPYIKIIDK